MHGKSALICCSSTCPRHAKAKSQNGIAYNLFEWHHHENAEGSVQAIKQFTGRRVEDIAPPDLTDLCNKVENKIKKPTAKEPDAQLLLTELKLRNSKLPRYLKSTTPDMALRVLRQSADYMTTASFKMSRAGDDHYKWIKENVADFKDVAALFGDYEL